MIAAIALGATAFAPAGMPMHAVRTAPADVQMAMPQWVRPAMGGFLAAAVALTPMNAEAARSGGRVGGRAPAPRAAPRPAPRAVSNNYFDQATLPAAALSCRHHSHSFFLIRRPLRRHLPAPPTSTWRPRPWAWATAATATVVA